MDRWLVLGLSLLLILAPLRFGSVEAGASAAVVVACLLLGILWVAWRSRRGLSPLPWRHPVLVGGTLFVLFGIIQTFPLPRPVLQTISPKAIEIRDRFEPQGATIGNFLSDESPPDRGWRPISLYPWATRQATLRFIAYLLAALITMDLVVSRWPRKFLVGALVTSGGIQALYGLAEFFSGHQHIFGYSKKYYTEVATGTFINRNHYAGYLEMILPLTVALAAGALMRLRSGRGGTPARRLEKASGREMFTTTVLFLLALTVAIALVCSRSRMGIASSLLGLLAVGLYLAWRGRGKSFAATALVVAAATFFIFNQAGAGSTVLDRFRAADSQFTGDFGRWSMWSQAANMAAAFPLIGVGLGAFPHVFPAFRTAGEGIALSHAHNDYLELTVETGAVGCIVVFLGIFLVARSVRGRKSGTDYGGHFVQPAFAGLLAIAFHSITDFNLAIPSNALTLAVLIGLAISWKKIPGPVPVTTSEELHPWLGKTLLPAGLLVAVVLIAVAPVVAEVNSQNDPGTDGDPVVLTTLVDGAGDSFSNIIDGDNAGRRFQAAGRAGQSAIQDLRVLVQAQMDGINPSPVAAAYIERRLRSAIDLQAGGLRHFPTSSTGHLGMGKLKFARCAARTLGDDEEFDCLSGALAEFRLALQLNPMGVANRAGVARFLISSWPALGEDQRTEAARIINRTIKFNKDEPSLQSDWQLIQESRETEVE